MLENHICHLRRISIFCGLWFYSFTFPLPSYPSTQEWECKEKNSYTIESREFVKANSEVKKYPKRFVEKKEKDLKTFEVFYDSKKGTGIINGSPVMVIAEYLEIDGKALNNIETITNNDDGQIIKIKQKFLARDTYIPLTFFSSSSDLEESTEVESGFFNKNEVTKTSISTDKKYFTIEDSSSYPEFFLLRISSFEKAKEQYSDNEDGTLDVKELIELSNGSCELLVIKK